MQDFGEPIAPFTLTDQKNESFSSDRLRGKVWIAHFFFTTCTGGCTKTTPTMAELQRLIRGKPDLVLVSISLNSDTPEDLKKFAEGLDAEPGQWFFLTGEKAQVHKLVQTSFGQTARPADKPEPGKEIEHDFRLVVIDGHGAMRGYIDGQDLTTAPRIQQRMRSLAAARYLLPAVNAGLNSLCTILLIAGYVSIRSKQVTLHKICMLSALVTSAVFLSSYLYFHLAVLNGKSTEFLGQGWVRPAYFTLLISHMILAALVAPVAVTVGYLGLRNRLARHVRLARWTLPIWLYVSITGVVVYVVLYRLYPPY